MSNYIVDETVHPPLPSPLFFSRCFFLSFLQCSFSFFLQKKSYGNISCLPSPLLLFVYSEECQHLFFSFFLCGVGARNESSCFPSRRRNSQPRKRRHFAKHGFSLFLRRRKKCINISYGEKTKFSLIPLSLFLSPLLPCILCFDSTGCGYQTSRCNIIQRHQTLGRRTSTELPSFLFFFSQRGGLHGEKKESQFLFLLQRFRERKLKMKPSCFLGVHKRKAEMKILIFCSNSTF